MESSNIITAIFSTILKITLSVAVIILVYRGVIIGYEFGYSVFKQQPMTLVGEGRTVTVTIPEDMTPSQMAKLFEKHGLIDNTTLFLAQYYLSEFKEEVKPGVYELSTTMTVEEMMEVMATPAEEEENKS